MTEHVAFLMKDLVLLAVSFYLLREDVKRVSLPATGSARSGQAFLQNESVARCSRSAQFGNLERKGFAPVAKSVQQSAKEVSIMKSLTFIQWYRILRAHHQWTVFQSIRYALWLMR
jgi:hypothetical protein